LAIVHGRRRKRQICSRESEKNLKQRSEETRGRQNVNRQGKKSTHLTELRLVLAKEARRGNKKKAEDGNE